MLRHYRWLALGLVMGLALVAPVGGQSANQAIVSLWTS